MSLRFCIQWRQLIVIALWVIASNSLQGQSHSGATSMTYKKVDTTALDLTIYSSQSQEAGPHPAIIFFFGGGWKGGSIDQFRPHAAYFSSRGMVAILADYRVSSRQATTPFDAVKDAKSAIRFVRSHAEDLNVDPDRICAAGGSAGGHLAAATAAIDMLNDVQDDLKVSAKPNALVLYNPVIDNGPNGYGYDRVGDRYKEMSPFHNVLAGFPPTIFFLGSEDPLIPVSTARSYQQRLKAVGTRCDLYVYEGQKHGFFNKGKDKYYRETVYQSDLFLQSLGYLKGEPSMVPLEIQSVDPVSSTHAHNDYRHDRPLVDALANGFVSVEADLLLKKDQLYVGHDRVELDQDPELLEDLYLKPLFRRFNALQGEIYPDYGGQFYLWLDIKYDGNLVYPLLEEMLIPYHEMLTSRLNGELRTGKVTIIVSGDRPIDIMVSDTSQWMFVDGRPHDLTKGIDSDVMPVVSSHYSTIFNIDESGNIPELEMFKLTEFIRQCHSEGKKARLWATPDEPHIWEALSESNIDFINTDSLAELAEFLIVQKL